MQTNLAKRTVGILEDNFTLRTNIEQYLNVTGAYDVLFSEPKLSGLATEHSNCIPDYILLDIHLQGEKSLGHIGELKQLYPSAGIIIMTGDNDEQLIMEAFENGAGGYIYKPFKLAALSETIDKMEADGSYLQPQVATKLISMLKKKDVVADLKEELNLTEREAEIVQGIKEGLSYKQIGERLFISPHTVNHHLKNVYLKADVTSRNELVAKYLNG